LAAARRRARPRDPDGRVDEPHQPPARDGIDGFACVDVRLPARAAAREHLPRRRRGHRAARHQHARRDRGADDRRGAGGFARSVMSADAWIALGTAGATLVLLVVPVLVYGWYALEGMIDDDRSYERVSASVSK